MLPGKTTVSASFVSNKDDFAQVGEFSLHCSVESVQQAVPETWMLSSLELESKVQSIHLTVMHSAAMQADVRLGKEYVLQALLDAQKLTISTEKLL